MSNLTATEINHRSQIRLAMGRQRTKVRHKALSKKAFEDAFPQLAKKIEKIITRNGIVAYKASLLAAEIEKLEDHKQLVLFCSYLAFRAQRDVLLAALIARELRTQAATQPEKMAQARQWAKAQKSLISPKVNHWLTKPQPQQKPSPTKLKPAKKKALKSIKSKKTTPVSLTPAAIYQRQLARYPVLPDAEITNLVKAGTPGAKRRLVEHNLRLVISVVGKYYYPGCGLTFIDLVQEGNIGLMRAAEKFEVRQGCKFSTYAVWWIREKVLRAITNLGRTIRLPVHLDEDMKTISRTKNDLETKLGKPPTEEELVKALSGKMKPDKIAKINKIKQRQYTRSLNTPRTDKPDARALIQYTPDTKIPQTDELLIAKERRSLVQQAIARLPEREADVLNRIFFKGETSDTIANHYEVTGARIRQIKQNALKKLRLRAAFNGLSNI